MIRLSTKISKHVNDLIQKYISSLFKNATLEFYGIKTARIKELINVELPVVEVSGSGSDTVFLLEDGTYLHVEFQTTYNKTDLIRFAGYDLRLYGRDGRVIITVVIYTADVKEVPMGLNIGSLIYSPHRVMMADYDGNSIYNELNEKIKTGLELSDTDMLNLIFLPLMRNNIPRKELVAKSVELAQTIPDIVKRNACIAAAFAFANKYLNESEINKLLEAIKMTDLATMLIRDDRIEVAKNALRKGFSITDVADITGVDESTIRQLQEELRAEI